MWELAIKSGSNVIFFHNTTVTDSALTKTLLEKYAGRNYQLPKGYYLRMDNAHIPSGMNHFHVEQKGRLLGAFNSDGTPHDNSNFRIPKVVADYVNQNFPSFNIPDGRYVKESLQKEASFLLLQKVIKDAKQYEVLLFINFNKTEPIELDDE